MGNETFVTGETCEEMLEVYVKEKGTIDPNRCDKLDFSDGVGQRGVDWFKQRHKGED